MEVRKLKKISLISIAVILALVSAFAVASFFTGAQPTAKADTGTLYASEYVGDVGTTRYTRDEIAAKYGVQTSEVIGINSGSLMYMFLAGENFTSYKVGYLTKDVAIAYNATKDGYDTVNLNSSSAIFDKIFDGNGYTVSIYGGGGECESQTEIKDDDGYRFTRRQGASRYAGVDIWYEYTGYLVAQNYGTIANMTIDFTSPHTSINANKGSTGTNAGDLGSGSYNRICSSRQGLFCAGIVTGLNGYDGVIDNVKLNIRNAFTAIKKASSNTGYFTENTAYVGGLAGRIEDNSTINECWVDIASNAGVFAGAEGKPTSFSMTDDHYSLAVAGGLVGNIDRGTGKITYSVLSGRGTVKAFANRASRDERFQAFAGGVAGGCIYINGTGSVHDSNDSISVNLGQIKGILSSWTGSRFTNYKNSPVTVMGAIFDSVGTDDAIESVGLLYDVETLMDSNPSSTKPQSSDGKTTIDRAGNLRSWLAIHPTSEGGSMTVEFDTDNPTYDIRIHIVADGHDEFKNSGVMDEVQFTGSTRYYQYKMSQGEGGGFIWSGTFETGNDSSNHINLDLDDPIYAEIYLISSKNSGKYNYEFGTMGQLAYTDTNGSNGNLVRAYAGMGSPLNLPAVTVTNDNAFDTNLFNDQSLWQISRGSANGVNLTQTYMPGTYTMKLEAKLGERTYGYYNEDLRYLAWQPTSDYVFTILQGQLNYGSGTTATDGWQSSVTFELKMSGINDFDTVEFQRNGAFPSDSTSGFRYSGGSAFYTVTAGTGKNGMAYTFYAYKRDIISGENVLVAVSESRTVRIDTEAPEISDIEYYIVEDGGERLLSEDELEEIQLKWTKNQILAKFSVSDNEKSGIATAATETFVHDTILNNSGDREVVVEINDSTQKTLYYIDARGNETAVNLQVNVDRVQGRLSFAGSSYRPEGRFNYSTKNVTVRYIANFGMSGWRLYYSYQKDSAGEDIWIATPDLLTDSGAVKTFTIDWNMGNVTTGIGDDFKIKMINEAGLYEDEVFPTTASGGQLNADNVIGTYVIWLRIANIYLDTSLDHVLLEGGNGKSVADILADGEGATYFDKEYDGTDKYDGKKEYKFYTDLSILNTNGFYFNDELGVIYSPAGMSRPRINIGNSGIVPIELKYSTSEVGAAKLSFSATLTGVDGYNYIVYFTDLSAIDFEADVEVEEGTYFESYEIDVNINKRQVTINLADQEDFNAAKHYYYGDAVPTSIEAYVEAIDGCVTVQISTGASASANIGPYTVEGVAVNSARSNIEYTVTPTSILIEQRPVAVDLRYDGGTIGNVPSSAQSGRTHTITGTYEDVNGDTQTAIVQYTLNGAPVNTLGAVGEYTIELSLPNNNYVIDGQTSFRFNILKGYLDITTGVRVKDYTESEIIYDMIIPAESRELYADSDLRVTYYRYLEGAVYNAAAGTVTGKISEEAMEGYPTERGYYYVKVEFATTDSPNFFPKSDYADGYLVITSAQTKVNVEKVALEYSYTAQKFTFDLVDAVAEVRSSSNKQLWSASSPADGTVKVQYKDARGNFVDVAPTPNDGGGWYSEVGRYEYRINYIGNADYRTSHVDVVMIINKAELQGITFNPVTATYDGNKHLPTVGGLLNYTGLKITFQYGTTRITCDGTNASTEIQRLNIASAGQHNITMTVDKDGYATKELQATVNIAKATMEGVSAKVIDVTYDGRRHTIEFLGLDRDESGNYSYKGENVIISAGGTEGSAYATDVYIEPGVGPSYYVGSVTLTSPNYQDLTLNTQITIRQALLPYKEIGKDLPNKLPSAMDLQGYKGYFVDSSGKKVECALQYTDKDGNVVALDENGTLADGRYTVMIVIPSNNFYIDKYWNFEIGEINSKEIPTLGYVAIGVVGAVMLAAVVTAIVVVQKRKKAGIV